MTNDTYVSYRDDLPTTYKQALKFLDRVYWRSVQYDLPCRRTIATACSEILAEGNNEYVSNFRCD